MELTGPKPTDIAYLAGVFDGEGCVLFDRINVDNTNPHLLVMYRDAWGGRIRFKSTPKEHRTCFRWTVMGDNCRNALKAMMPYLIEKKEQAEINLIVTTYPPKSAMRSYHKQKLKELKRIDYGEHAESLGIS